MTKDTLRLQKKEFPVGVIEMIVAEVVLAVCVAILFAVFVKQCVRIERCEDNMGMSEAEIQELRRRCDAYKELIEALSKSVRELNGVVEAAVKVKEETSDNKPDTKALMGGWIDDVIERFDGSLAYSTNSKEICQYIADLLKELQERRKAPEIVRCGECKHRDPEDKKCDCGHDIIWQLPRDDDWFCADAERRTDK